MERWSEGCRMKNHIEPASSDARSPLEILPAALTELLELPDPFEEAKGG